MEDLYRAISPGLTFIERDDQPARIEGKFTVFGRKTVINNYLEGPPFAEIIQRGAFAKSIQESLSKIRVLFSHGKDPSVGIKPLGTIDRLEEHDDGPHFTVTLLDAPYVRALVPAMRAGLLGMSFHAGVVVDKMREVMNPEPSPDNPDGLPERTYSELRLREFGPTPFPAVDGTELVVRSDRQEILFAEIREHPDEFRRLMDEGAVVLNREGQPEDSTDPEDEPQHSEATTTQEEDRPSWLLS